MPLTFTQTPTILLAELSSIGLKVTLEFHLVLTRVLDLNGQIPLNLRAT